MWIKREVVPGPAVQTDAELSEYGRKSGNTGNRGTGAHGYLVHREERPLFYGGVAGIIVLLGHVNNACRKVVKSPISSDFPRPTLSVGRPIKR